jgi:hypothetical protein
MSKKQENYRLAEHRQWTLQQNQMKAEIDQQMGWGPNEW